MHFLHLGLCWRRKINEINLYARGVVNRKMHLSLIFKNLHPRTKLKSFPLCCSPPPVTKSPTARATEWDFHFLRASLIARWNYVFLNRLMGRQQFPPACRAHCISILISNTRTSIQKNASGFQNSGFYWENWFQAWEIVSLPAVSAAPHATSGDVSAHIPIPCTHSHNQRELISHAGADVFIGRRLSHLFRVYWRLIDGAFYYCEALYWRLIHRPLVLDDNARCFVSRIKCRCKMTWR